MKGIEHGTAYNRSRLYGGTRCRDNAGCKQLEVVMREPLIIECLEFERREWLSALHDSDRAEAPEVTPSPRVGSPTQENMNPPTMVKSRKYI